MQYFVIMWRGPLHTTADPKFERKIPTLIADFCTYYAPHANHSVIYYYDVTALGSNYAVNDQDFHWVVVYEFERRGWSVQDVYLGNPMRHDEKYLLINQGFFRQATLDALLQPPNVVQMRTKSNLFELCRVQPTFVKQWRSYSCHTKCRGGTWKKRLSQKQVHREKSRIRGGLVGASHRWHWCFWYAVYWVWKVPAAWFLWSWWSEIKSRRLTILVRICEPSCFLSIMLIIK